jgi:hypothetical protein
VTSPPRPPTTTPAQERVVDEVLGWGRPRPVAPSGLVDELRGRFDNAFREAQGTTAGGSRAGGPSGRRTVPVRALVGDPRPGGTEAFTHDRDTLRGVLLTRSFARDVELGQTGEPADVAAAVADEVAAERPADPGSASVWWNAAPRPARDDILAEVGGVLADLRLLWPPLGEGHLAVAVRRQLRTPALEPDLVLTARPDLVLDSPRRDDRARALVVVTRSGMPRPAEDRALARATALVHTLADGRPPFRWAVLHLTDGRFEPEDLDAEVLAATAAQLGRRAARYLSDERPTGWSTVGDPDADRPRSRGRGGAR